MSEMQVVRHNPDQPEKRKGKAYVGLVSSDYFVAETQILREGGENNLHSHPRTEGFWYVLRGRARFYEGQTEVFAEVGPDEGVYIPKGAKYWFESAGEEPLHVLRIAVRTEQVSGEDRVDHEERAGDSTAPVRG